MSKSTPGFAICEDKKCRGVPIYGTLFEENQSFFLKRGFRVPKRAMSVVSMRKAA